MPKFHNLYIFLVCHTTCFFLFWQMLDKTSTSFESFCCVGPGTLWITVLLGRGGDTSRGWHQRWLENILKKLWWMEVYNWFIAGKHHQSNWCSIVTITGQKKCDKTRCNRAPWLSTTGMIPASVSGRGMCGKNAACAMANKPRGEVWHFGRWNWGDRAGLFFQCCMKWKNS